MIIVKKACICDFCCGNVYVEVGGVAGMADSTSGAALVGKGVRAPIGLSVRHTCCYMSMTGWADSERAGCIIGLSVLHTCCYMSMTGWADSDARWLYNRPQCTAYMLLHVYDWLG